MLVNRFFFGTFLLLLIACTNTNSKENKIPPKSINADSMLTVSKYSVDSLNSSANTLITKNDENTLSTLFEYKNDTILQRLVVKYLSKTEIKFDLTSFNKIKNKTSTLSGTASGKLNQDPEMDEDDQGNAYAVEEYQFTKNDCSLSIRIDRNSKNRAKVFDYNCVQLHDNNCPFQSIGILLKVQK